MIQRKFVCLIVALLGGGATFASATGDDDHAVILAYHHISDDTPPGTSVTPAQFAAHLDYIDANGYLVWPLTRLVKKLRAGQSVPANVVALTFDDGYESVYSRAWPMLKRRGWPFTVFVNPEAIDRHQALYMSWPQLAQLAAHDVEIGNHTQTHEHMTRMRGDEDVQAWLARLRNEVAAAQSRISDRVGLTPTLFAYPYGEYTAELSAALSAWGLTGFGQHSGAIGVHSDFGALPRFPMGGNYSDVEQLAMRLRTQPLNITADPAGPLRLQADDEGPLVRLHIPPGPYDPARIACYASGQGRMQLSVVQTGKKSGLETAMLTVAIKPLDPLGPGRSKYNCTIPHSRQPGVYFWWSYLLMKPLADGAWYSG